MTFDNGTVLLRCLAHDTQRWTVDGVTVGVAEALQGLRTLFADRRGPSRRPHATPVVTPARPTVVALDRPAYETSGPALLGADADEQLTALLHARGLQGSWAVA